MLDCVIRGGSVIDGSGSPRRRADLGIRDGRIAAIGQIAEDAAVAIDATGKIVAPGFVDIHTHYDAQGFWDGTLSPSPFHGVTTVVGGNCGFSIAPLDDQAGDYLMRMLARVEGMPLESLQQGVPWNWTSFGEYLAALDGRLSINAGFMVGHSALRRVVMGDAAVGSEATPDQLSAMVALLERSLSEGGLGFSSTNAPTHNDAEGQPVPSRHATPEEFVALAGALKSHPGTSLEFLPTIGEFSEQHKELMTKMSLAAGRSLNWNVLAPSTFNEGLHENQLSAGDYAAARGAKIVALTLPQMMTLRINLHSGFIFDAFPNWPELIALPIEERKRALADPAVRRRLDEGAHSEGAGVMRALAVWENMRIDETFCDETAGHAGRTLGEIAEERGGSAFDALCDIAIADDLRTSFMPNIPGDDDASWKLRAEVWQDPRAMIGASDAGAHLDMIDTFTASTALIGPAVRDRGLLTLEDAVHKLSDVPARLYGIRERGRLEAGWHADVVVFDEARVGPGPVHTRKDLPAGAGRLYACAEGIEHVLVGGVEVVRGQEATAARPGTVLRSGRDTETVAIPGA
jgi:N-acyl-D-aspartate/D-glutamate deacylase